MAGEHYSVGIVNCYSYLGRTCRAAVRITVDMDMLRKVVTLTVVMWIGLAGVPAQAASSGGSSWTAAMVAWLTEAFSGGEIQPDDNGVIHLD
jgi:hypothetical protein